MPDALVRQAIDQSFELAERLAGKEDVIRRAGVEELKDLRQKATRRVRSPRASGQEPFLRFLRPPKAPRPVRAESLTTLIDIPLLFILSLRTILKIGHCYGYPLDQRRDRHFVVRGADCSDFGHT